ncbi:hypothetical protein HPB48_023321 [Haemaphysalis longicornis]|uniref:Uncharacterized protein n=1 Tax=Haemaphysalis longicornis TaxID=44386 RepID=A0A9J6H6V7_HAELO|nr:hypothetical protein HPB48_023321 [Haemaphysalis longicornis]
MQSTNYLRWGETHFWDTLYLPKRDARTRVIPRYTLHLWQQSGKLTLHHKIITSRRLHEGRAEGTVTSDLHGGRSTFDIGFIYEKDMPNKCRVKC